MTNCKFLKVCDLADEDNPVCMDSGGVYYVSGGYCGMFRELQAKEDEQKELEIQH
jgi:hypothetical protein